MSSVLESSVSHVQSGKGNMPDMDGITASKEIKSLPGGSKIPIIMITGFEKYTFLDPDQGKRDKYALSYVHGLKQKHYP